ncbi:phosphopentomutase [Fictibacillus sp. JL2B1089]|uniref:phosphopentomutase n=1 Tax=Fictibacillus sp. JL2B1089 TaxID=3399565 RepID=UPI003A899DE9
MGKISLLILDGFGIGAMDDCAEVKPEDMNANTYKHLRAATKLHIPFLYELGLCRLVDNEGEPKAAYGKNNLAHHGADTYMGHQELMGSKPGIPQNRFMNDVGDHIKKCLEEEGCHVSVPIEGGSILLVNGCIVVGDNLESSPGNIINVVCDLNQITFEEASKIGRVVRSCVDTSRVIVFGNKKSDIVDILSAVTKKNGSQWGVDSPKTNVYGEGYHVLHLGYGVDFHKQFPYIAEANHVPVYRIGKTADVIQASGFKDPVVETKDVLRTYRHHYRKAEDNAVFLVNVQETDLAGHKQDVNWYKEVLEVSDRFIGEFIKEMSDEDVLFITGDHGNDPTIGHSNHTREQTPLLVIGEKITPVNLEVRTTMADIAATMAELAGVPQPEYGKSFLKEIKRA